MGHKVGSLLYDAGNCQVALLLIIVAEVIWLTYIHRLPPGILHTDQSQLGFQE